MVEGMNGGQGPIKMNAKAFAAKFKSKKECWNFLAIEANAFLPPYGNCTIYHMKELVAGCKKSKLPVD